MAGSPASKPAGLSVFFPAYNDSGTIASMVIRAVKAASELTPDFEVIIVDDGSADGTADIADELARTYPQVRAVHHPINRDYGAALQTGFRSATKELIFYTDGDAQYDPSELAVLWAPDVGGLRPGERLQDQPRRSAAPDRHRPRLPPHRQHDVRSEAARRRLRLPVDAAHDLRAHQSGEDERHHLRGDDEEDSGCADSGLSKCRCITTTARSARSQFFNFRRLFRTGRDLLLLWTVLVVAARAPASRRDAARGARGRPGQSRLPEPAAACDRRLSGVLPRPRRDDHRRHRIHRQQSRAAPRRAGRRRAARRFADPRLRRQPVQHRRHRRSRARQRCGHPPADDDELPRPRLRRDLQPRGSGQPHRQHARSVHGSRNQLPQPADRARGVPQPQRGREGRVRRHAAGVRASRFAARHRGPSRAADRRQRHQQGGRRVLPPGLQQRVRRARVLASPDERVRSAAADQTQPPGIRRVVHPARDRGQHDPDLR